MLGIGVRIAASTRSGMIDGPGMATSGRPKRSDIVETVAGCSPNRPIGESGRIVLGQAA